jgi:phosphopantetheinyl transferase (holo-ACP synthase)
MPFDIAGAKQAGYTDAEILGYLAPQAKFDVDGAKKAGYNDTEILGFLGQKVGKPASTERTWGEALVTDPVAALIGGGAQVLQLPGQLQRLVTGTGKPEEGLEGWGKRSEEITEQMKSAGLKAREQARSAKVATAAENGILEAAGVAAWETIKDPALLSTLLTQQIPQLAISGGVGTVAKGFTAARMASAGAAKEAIEKTALKVGVSAGIATGALLQGTDVGSDTYDETYKYLVKNGTKPEEAHDIAVSKARQSAAAAAAISVATQNIPGANRLERGLLGAKGGEGVFRGALKTGAGESFTEGLEEGGGAVAKNFAIGQVDPTRQLSQGVGEAIGLGAVGGLGLGAPIGAIQGRAEAVRSQLIKDTETITGIDPIPSNKDALVKQYQTLLGIPREEAGMLADQIIAENVKATEQAVTPETTTEQATTPGAVTTELPAQIPAGVDPQRLEEIEIEYVNAGFSIKEAKAKALEQAIQEVKIVSPTKTLGADVEVVAKLKQMVEDPSVDRSTIGALREAYQKETGKIAPPEVVQSVWYEKRKQEQEKANANISTVPASTGTGATDVGAGTATDIQQQLGQSAGQVAGAQPDGMASAGASAAQSAAGKVGEPSALGQPAAITPEDITPEDITPEDITPVVVPKAPTKEIKASINAATQILKQNKLPYSPDLLAQFTDKDTGLVNKEAVLAYAKQQTPVATDKKTLSQEDIGEKLNDLYLDSEGKKSSVIAFAKKLVAQGILPQGELDSLTRMSKDRDIDKDEVLRELETTLENVNNAALDAPTIKPESSIQAGYEKALRDLSIKLEAARAYLSEVSLRRSNPDKAQKAARELINVIINKWENNARRQPQGTYGEFEIESIVQQMRQDPGGWDGFFEGYRTIGGQEITNDTYDAYYKRNKPDKEEINAAASDVRERQAEYDELLNESKKEREVTSKLLKGEYIAAINQKIALGTINRTDARFYLGIASSNARQALEAIVKRNATNKIDKIHQLVAKLLLAANITPDIEFYNFTKPTTAGIYRHFSDLVRIDAGLYIQGTSYSNGAFSAYPDITQLTGTFLHELIHASTISSLSKAYPLLTHFRQGGTESTLNQAQIYYVHSQEYRAAKNIIEVFDWLVTNHGDKFTNLKTNKNYTYGATNPFELVAEVFLDDKLHDVLANITLPENLAPRGQSPNAWDWFLSAIRKLINIRGVPNNALDQIMRSTTEAMRSRQGIAQNTLALPTEEEVQGHLDFNKKYEARTNINNPSTSGGVPSELPSVKPPAPPPPPTPPQGGAQPAPKKRRKAAPKKTGADKILERIDKSTLADETVGLIGELARAKSFDDVIGILKAGFGTLNSKKIQALLPALTTSQIIDWVGSKIPRLVDANRMVERMDTMRMKMLSAMSDIVTPWFDYSKEYTSGSKVLSRTMHYTTLAGVDPTLFPNLAAALTGDTTLVQLNKDLASAITPKDKTKIKGEITKRTNLLTTAYKLWDQLGSIGKGEGRAIYAKVKDHYKAMFDLHRVLLDRLIVNSTVPGNENDASTPKGKLMAAIRKSYADALKSGVYFPLMRYGNYWVSVGKGVGREFYMFESEFQRDQFVREKVEERQKAGDARKKEKMQEDGDLDYGNDLTKLRNKATESSEMLRGIFEMVDKNKNTGTQTADTEALKDAIYQMYLTTLPEKDFRKQWIHRKGTAGFSGDALRNFVRAGFSNSGHLSKLRYGHDITLAIDAAHDSLKGNPDKPLLEQFVNEIGIRTGLELNPDVEEGLFSKFANGINQAAFVMYLTGAKSAVANMTAIPIFGYPVLASRYGIGKSATKLASYMNIFNHTTVVTSKPNGDLQWPSVSIGMSKHVQGNRVLAAAFADAAERGITEITRTYDLLQMSRLPSDALSNPAVKFKRAAINMMGSMFHASERMNREIMYMASFELAYEKAVGEGKVAGINGEAYNIAVDAAVKNTYDSMFNYSRFNRPRVFRPAYARVALQFKMFPQQVTVYLVKNFYSMLPFIKGNDNKKEAATQLFGTLAMTGLFAGAAGMPLYSVIMGVLQGLRSALQDDDEPIPIEERDLDLWFRNVFLPQMLGVRGAEIAYRGLASEAGGDIASSTSLNNMWFREVKNSPSLAAEFRDSFFALLGPGFALVESVYKAGDDFKNGYISQGLEKLTPAMFRGMITATRWNEEGVKTKGLRASIYDEEEVTRAMLAWKVLGFTPTDLSRIQAENFKHQDEITKINRTKQEILNRINLDIDRGDDAHLEKEFEKFSKFLRDYPSVKFDADTILNSVQKRAELRAMANRGLSIPEELQGEIYPLLSEGR